MRWLPYLNVVLVVALVVVATLFFFRSPEESLFPSFEPRMERTELPKSPFTVEGDHEWDEGALALNWVPPLMQLPDLREEIQFFGQNCRPDAMQGKAAYHLGLKSSGMYRSIREGERVYLVYQGSFTQRPLPVRESADTGPLWGDVASSSSPKGCYLFSPDNQPTPLWIETYSKGNGSLVLRVSRLDEKGGVVLSPAELRQITLHAQEFPRAQVTAWELGNYRVDSTLLVRQKARWIGPDRFLEMHGGDEFAFTCGKERIDFVDKDPPYSCFLGPQDFLIWKGERWVNPLPGESTEHYPLLAVKKIDEKIMNLELWDTGGRAKTPLSLVRVREHQKSPNLAQEFKFVGAKTWAQFIVECQRHGGRLTLRPHDWLVLTQEGWKKLETAEEIDAYVEGRLSGPLFILDKMAKQNGRQVLCGHLFNASRTDVEEVELEAHSNTSSLANYCRTLPVHPPLKPQVEGDEE